MKKKEIKKNKDTYGVRGLKACMHGNCWNVGIANVERQAQGNAVALRPGEVT
jgi:hypothetical protein